MTENSRRVSGVIEEVTYISGSADTGQHGVIFGIGSLGPLFGFNPHFGGDYVPYLKTKLKVNLNDDKYEKIETIEINGPLKFEKGQEVELEYKTKIERKGWLRRKTEVEYVSRLYTDEFDDQNFVVELE